MLAGICAICDSDTAFLARLAAFLMEKRNLPFEIQPFSDPKALIHYAADRPVAVLLIAEDLFSEEIRQLHAGVLFVLQEEKRELRPDGGIPLDKYQSGDVLVKIILETCAARLPEAGSPAGTSSLADRTADRKISAAAGGPVSEHSPGRLDQPDRGGLPGKTDRGGVKGFPGETAAGSPAAGAAGLLAGNFTQKAGGAAQIPYPETEHDGIYARQGEVHLTNATVIGVYSPIGRCGKTTLSICMGQILARQNRTIYLNMETYHGFSSLTGMTETADISDLFYLLRTGETNPAIRLNSMVHSWDELDYLPPAVSGYDLQDISAGEWQVLLRLLGGSCAYQMIIADVGTRVADPFAFLHCCDLIFVPVLEDAFSKAKIRQFEENLETFGYAALQRKVRYVQVPEGGALNRKGAFPARLSKSAAGQYAWQLLGREKLISR